MKVVFRVDSSQQIGSGHVMRCLTLAERFKIQKSADVIFLMRDLDGNLIDLVKKQGYEVKVIPRSKIFYDLSGYAAWLTVPQEIDAEQSISCLSGMGIVDLLVVDSYAIDILWENKLRPYSKKIMAIDDLANRRHDCDILLDQNLHENMENRYIKLVPPKCRLLLGPRYALLRKEFYDIKSKERARNGEIANLLVYFGGSDNSDETSKTLNAINKLNIPELVVNVVVGVSNKQKDRIECMCRKHRNWHYFCQINNMAELMNMADLAIGAGGTTTWERLYINLPSIVISVADNQKEVCEACASQGLIMYLGESSNVTDVDIYHKLCVLFHNSRKV